MKILVVFDHPRRESFCGSVLDSFLAGLAEAGHAAEIADLRAEGFDPRLPLADEPDWDDDDKIYSTTVLAEQARIARSEALAFVFPVWWWSFPATTKGWIDRVWNNGWAYGARKLPHQSALLIGTASATAESYRKRGYDEAMRVQLCVGVMNYCGIARSQLEILYDVMEGESTRTALLARSHELGATYFT
ncbi:NAD(P)H oxidoreductase [Aestuariivirga sp.]|uniref:NAD(P)H oxidoreductase n=1 Tax=Aestuariivirga sp. TaxID=2650926 RepID=UPI00391CAA6F